MAHKTGFRLAEPVFDFVRYHLELETLIQLKGLLHAKVGKARAAAIRKLIHDRETALLQPLLDFLSGHPGVRLIGRDQAAGRAPTVAFLAQEHASKDLARRLSEFRLGVGSGNFYAYRLLQALGIDTDDGVVRASFVHYTSEEEVGRLIGALRTLL